MKFEHHLVKLPEIQAEKIDDQRIYHTPDGNYPSVTTVLDYGKDGIQEWRDRVGHEEADKITRQAGRQGGNVHEMLQYYVQGLSVESIFQGRMPNEKAMFLQIQPMLDKHLGRIAAIECPLYSNYLRVGGRTDLVAEWDKELAIIDFKTSRSEKKEEWILPYYQQCSAYAVMFEERTKIPVSKIVLLIASSGGMEMIREGRRDTYINGFVRARKGYFERNGF